MTSHQNKWTREELILTLSVYFQLPFVRLRLMLQRKTLDLQIMQNIKTC